MENSRKYDMAMAFGYIEAFMADGSGEFDESRRKVFENKLAIVSGDEVIMDYAKIHPFRSAVRTGCTGQAAVFVRRMSRI